MYVMCVQCLALIIRLYINQPAPRV